MLKKIVLIGILGSTTALASQDNNKDFYVQLNGGIAYGQNPKGDFSHGTLDRSALYGFAVGYKFHEEFSVDWSLDYRSNFENNYSTTNLAGSHLGEDIYRTDTYNIKVKSLVSMINFYYDITKMNQFTPYLTFGAGLARNETNNHTVNYNSTENDPAMLTTYSKGTKTDFAWKIGLGSKYAISKDFDLDLRYQYAELGKFTTGETAALNDESYESTPAKTGSIRSHEILLGIAYKF